MVHLMSYHDAHTKCVYAVFSSQIVTIREARAPWMGISNAKVLSVRLIDNVR